MPHPQIYAFADEASPLLSGQIEAMKRNQLQGLEIRNVDGENIAGISIAKAKEIKKAMDGAGLVVWSLGSPIGKTDIEADDFDKVADSLKKCLETAHAMGSQNIRMFSFYIPAGKDPAQYRNKVLDRLGRMALIAKGSGVTLCHENEKGIYGDMAGRCAEILREVPELAGVFDPANFVQCGQETWSAWELLRDRIKYMHIKDAMFKDGSVVPAGKGEGKVKEILSDYLARGGTALTLEPHLKVFDGLKTLERKGEQSVIGGTYAYPTSDAAFDAACAALKELL